MTETVIHEQAASGDSGAATGIILAVIILLVLAMIVVFGIPFMRGGANFGTPQVNVPGQVDVNVHGGSGGAGAK